MLFTGKPRLAGLAWILALTLTVCVPAGAPLLANPGGDEPAIADGGPGAILRALRPDYQRYIQKMRPLEMSSPTDPTLHAIYMALVKPGATDPARRESAPFAGPGVRNDVVYDRSSLGGGRSAGWALLLLDHEYFHARHLAGATSLPLPSGVGPEIERHFFEAAAWGFSVSEARAGSYPGLREDEFREALDRYGDHFSALRALTRDPDPQTWEMYSDLLRRPVALVTTTVSQPAGDPGRPSGLDRSPVIP